MRNESWFKRLALAGCLAAFGGCTTHNAHHSTTDGGANDGAVGAHGDMGESPNVDLAGVDLPGVVTPGVDMAMPATVNPPSGIWTPGGGGSATFSIGGQSVYGGGSANGATVTFGYLSSATY